MPNVIPMYRQLHEQFNDNFGHCTPLFPFPQMVSPGDFGWFRNGHFQRQGSLKKILKGKARLRIDRTYEESLLLTNKKSYWGEQANYVNEDGVWIVRKDLYHRTLPAYVIIMDQVVHLQMEVNEEVLAAVEELVEKGQWDEDYRLVWQCTQVEKFSYAYANAKQDRLYLMGKVDGPGEEWSLKDLEACLTNSTTAKGGKQLKAIKTTPCANFMVYDPSGEKWLEPVNGMCLVEELSCLQVEKLVPDNSNSFAI